MSWLIYVAINVFVDSTRIYTDNYISDVYFKGNYAVSQKIFLAFTNLIVGLIFAFCSDLDFASLSIGLILTLLLSGILSALAGVPYYRALELDDSTNLGIFIQLAPIMYLLLGWAFLGDTISPLQMLAFIIILAAPMLIILSSRKRSRQLKFKALFYAFLYVLIDVIGNLIFVKTELGNLDFFGALAIVFFGIGIGNAIITMLFPKWRRRFVYVIQKSRGKVLRPLLFAALLRVAKTTTYRLALVSAPAVALASVAADSTEPIVIFFMGLILTLIWPNFGREKLTKKNVLVHLTATILVVIGIVLLQVQ